MGKLIYPRALLHPTSSFNCTDTHAHAKTHTHHCYCSPLHVFPHLLTSWAPVLPAGKFLPGSCQTLLCSLSLFFCFLCHSFFITLFACFLSSPVFPLFVLCLTCHTPTNKNEDWDRKHLYRLLNDKAHSIQFF